MKKDSLFKDEMAAITAFEKLPENQVKVMPSLENSHPIVAATAIAISQQVRDNSICSTLSKEPVIGIDVSARLADRALRVCDALFKALEQRGVMIVTQSDDGASINAIFHLKGASVPFYIDEPTRSHPFEPATKEEWRVPPERWPKYRYLRSGVLRIKTSNDSAQGTYLEKRSSPLEGQINHLICVIFRQAFRYHEDEAMRRERDLWLKRVEERYQRFQRYLRRKEQWKKELHGMITGHHRANQIRQMLREMDRAGIAKSPEWVEWAQDYADSIDPLVRS